MVDTTKQKNPAAVALGRLGGKARVPKGMALVPPDVRAALLEAARAAKAEKRRLAQESA